MAPTPPTAAERVILVEDDAAVRQSVQFALELDAFSVDAFDSAAALLDGGDLDSLGCLVLDYHLPDTNGLDLLEHLRARGVVLPAVLVSTNPKAAVRRRAREAGVVIVEKPLLTDALSDAIRTALDGRPGA